MLLYRIARKVYANDMTGEGARLYGGRWNSIGKPVIYFAGSRSLAVLEVLVHIAPMAIPEDFVLVTYYALEDVCDLNLDKLPRGWTDVYPPASLQTYGDNFIAGNKQLLLKVPSVIVPQEFNYLLNPANPKIAEVKLISTEPFSFDERLIKSTDR